MAKMKEPANRGIGYILNLKAMMNFMTSQYILLLYMILVSMIIIYDII